jgi:hypothetical protein
LTAVAFASRRVELEGGVLADAVLALGGVVGGSIAAADGLADAVVPEVALGASTLALGLVVVHGGGT